MAYEKFTRAEIDATLFKLGFEIPKAFGYNGMRQKHVVRCLNCGEVFEKRLDNLVYRGEQCPFCNGVEQEEEWEIPADIYSIKIFTMLEEILDILTARQEPPQPVGDPEGVTAVVRKYIGFKLKKQTGKKHNSIDAWYDISHLTAFEIMKELAPDTGVYLDWFTEYTEFQKYYPTKQGHEILPMVVPTEFHQRLIDLVTLKVVKLG